MRCSQCGVENPNQSKFCRKCGELLGARLRCVRCGAENPGDSEFCTECGEKLSEAPKSTKGTQRKCKSCGQFNEWDALFCVLCREELIMASREDLKRPSAGPSYKAIVLAIGLIFLIGLFVKLGTSFFKDAGPLRASLSSAPDSPSLAKVDETQVVAVAKNFKCACGGCGEDPLETCACDMSNGAVEEKNFIREKLAEGLTVEQVIELVDKKYGHRV